eukprot:gene6643-biopygen241
MMATGQLDACMIVDPTRTLNRTPQVAARPPLHPIDAREVAQPAREVDEEEVPPAADDGPYAGEVRRRGGARADQRLRGGRRAAPTRRRAFYPAPSPEGAPQIRERRRLPLRHWATGIRGTVS